MARSHVELMGLAFEAERLVREVSVAVAAGDGAGLARLMAVAPEGMGARPLLQAQAVAAPGPGLGARHGDVPMQGVMSEEAFFAASAAAAAAEEAALAAEAEDDWEDGAVAD